MAMKDRKEKVHEMRKMGNGCQCMKKSKDESSDVQYTRNIVYQISSEPGTLSSMW